MRFFEEIRDTMCFPASFLLGRQIERQEKIADSQMEPAFFMQNMQDEGLVTGS